MARKGENIYRRADGRWEARFISGYDELTQKARYSYVYDQSYNAVRQKRIQIEKEGKREGDRLLTVKQCFTEWLEWKNTDPNLHISTLQQYRRHIEKHIIPRLGDARIFSLNSKILDDFRAYMLQCGRLDGMGGLSPTVVDTIITLVYSMLNYACDEGHISTVPKRKTRKITVLQRSKTRVLSVSEQLLLEEFLCKGFMDKCLVGVYMGMFCSLYTGLRVGELGALRWKDIDFVQCKMTVRQTLQRVSLIEDEEEVDSKTELHIGPPKSRSSERSFPIKTEFMWILKNYRDTLPTAQRKGDCHVFTYMGNLIEPRNFQNQFKRALKEAGIGDANFHCLRHTFATRCIESSMDVQSLSEYLGHRDSGVTLSVYTHSFEDHKKVCINRLTFLSPATMMYSMHSHIPYSI